MVISSNVDKHVFKRLFRGKATCGDIDIIITRPTDDGRNHSGRYSPPLRFVPYSNVVARCSPQAIEGFAYRRDYHGRFKLTQLLDGSGALL